MQREALAPSAASPHEAGSVERGQASRAGVPAVALLLLAKFPARAVPWGLSRLVAGVRALGPVPGLRFARVLGSGRDGGFGLAPGFDHQGFIGFFDDVLQAQAFADASRVVHGYREHAIDCLTVLMRATSSRGAWGGVGLAVSAPARADTPVAVITRASIRLRHAVHFWRHAPATHDGIARAPGCRLAIGLGEAPLLRQATFSLWDDTAAMEAYAGSGAHRAASRGAWQQGWFGESMFLRLQPLSLTGQWKGQAYG